MTALGKNIRSLRHRKGWSQQEIAIKLNISIATFSKIETGITGVNLSRLEQIATVFGISLTELLSLDDPNYKDNTKELELVNQKLLARETELADLQRKVIELFEELRQYEQKS